MASPPAKPQSRTSNVHIGRERFEKLDQKSIEVAFKTSNRTSPSSIVQYLLDNYLDQACEQIIASKV
jgi:hypothetical protein